MMIKHNRGAALLETPNSPAAERQESECYKYPNRKFKMGRVRRIHFVGIGGVGMCGIAEILLRQGYRISGSDMSDNSAIKRLRDLGAEIFQGHHANNIANADVLVQSTAIAAENPEVCTAKEKGIPVISRGKMLAEMMCFCYGIAVAGTHGKTTTTSLLASLLTTANLDPSFVIGGCLKSIASNARLGGGDYFVAEADESDASFLDLSAKIAIVTNIDADHMGTYQDDFSCLQQAFLEFIHRLPFYGLVVLGIDDPVVQTLITKIKRPMLSYGFAENADIRAIDYQQRGFISHFTLRRQGRADLPLTLNFPGQHNVLNALASIAVATELNIADEYISRSLANFSGVGRRFQRYGEFSVPAGAGTALLLDDYGHHPQEIAVTLATLRAVYPGRRIVLAFQPHRYTRTQDLFTDFVEILATADVLVLLDIYPAGEKPIDGINSAALCKNIRLKMNGKGQENLIHASNNEQLSDVLRTILQADDVLITQGAGSIGAMAVQLAQQFKAV